MMMPGVQKPHCRRVLLMHRLLEGAVAAVLCHRFDGGDGVALHLHRESEARPRRRAVDQHGAGAANAVLAADMGAGQAEILAQHVREQAARLDSGLVSTPIDRRA